MRGIVRGDVRLLALAALVAALVGIAAPAVRAEGRQADSDDYNCNHGAPDDPTTIEACNRLRGTSQGAGADVGHQYNSDDYNCNHGAANDPTTLAACQRLRGTTDGVGRDEGHLRNSDDWNCHHGVPGVTSTIEACHRLRGYAVEAPSRWLHGAGRSSHRLHTLRHSWRTHSHGWRHRRARYVVRIMRAPKPPRSSTPPAPARRAD